MTSSRSRRMRKEGRSAHKKRRRLRIVDLEACVITSSPSCLCRAERNFYNKKTLAKQPKCRIQEPPRTPSLTKGWNK